MKFIDLHTQYHSIKEAVDKSIIDVLESGQYIMGQAVKDLEATLSEYLGVKHAIGCSSGTDALLMALLAADIKAGDEVIVPAFSFFATAEMVALIGATPVMVDIDADTYNIDVAQVEKAITDKTKAVMPVSLYGQCAQMDELETLCDKHGLLLIEDAAQSFGAMFDGKHSGTFNGIGCTSFFPSKPLGCYGDGGACFTNDDALATKMRQLLSHGQTGRYEHQYVGINGRMDTIQAAVLIEKLKIFDDECEKRQNVAKRYQSLLEGVVSLPFISPKNKSVYAQYTIELDDRETVTEKLQQAGVPTAVHYPKPMHLQPALAYLGHKEGDFPISEAKAKRVVSLPMSPYLSEADQEKVADALKVAVSA